MLTTSRIPQTLIPDIVSQHAEDAAFLWTLRSGMVADSDCSFDKLIAVDNRVEAHLDGLRLSGNAGWELCRRKVVNTSGGEIFPLAALAFGEGDRSRMLDILTLAAVSADARRGLVSALAWLDGRTVGRWIRLLLDARLAAHRVIGVAACACRREDPGTVLAASVDDPDPVLRRRAIRAAGELKRGDLVGRVASHLTDADEGCRFWAAWTLTLHGDRRGLPSLVKWFGRGDGFERRALQLAFRAMSIKDGRSSIRALAAEARTVRSAIAGAGVLGDAACMPWLIDQMKSPALACVAGEAFSMITGVNLADANLDQRRPSAPDVNDVAEDLPSPDDDRNLAWPNPSRVAGWWQLHQHEFPGGVRYLAGQPIDPRILRSLLAIGRQRQRAAAAVEFALREPDVALVEVRGRASQQRLRLREVAPVHEPSV